MPPATATAASAAPPAALCLLPPLPEQAGLPQLRELCLDKVRAAALPIDPQRLYPCIPRGCTHAASPAA
eukprot:scaffold116609_cov69-Phaeocystis_antarctica.AAC.1